MSLQQIRWPVVLLSLVVALAAMFGAGYLLKSQTVDQPVRDLLARSSQVQSYTVAQVGDRQEITVRFAPSVDLKMAYAQLDDDLSRILKTEPYQLAVEDRRTPELEQVAARLDLYVEEAIATGQFTAMADRLAAEAKAVGATVKVGIDEERVYVSLIKNEDDGYLYRITDRSRDRTEGGGVR